MHGGHPLGALATIGIALTMTTPTASATTNPTTLDQLHQAGCVPITWPQAGPNTIRYNGTPDGCDGHAATLVYDRPDGTIATRLVDLAAVRYDVDPDQLGCGRTQVDLFVGDVRDEITAGTFNPAHRLITVNWLDGTQCAPPVQTTFATTPAPATTAPTYTPAPTPTFPTPPATGTTPDPQAPLSPPSVTPPAGGGGNPTPPIELLTTAPPLPVTGGRAARTAVVGALAVMLGTLAVGLGRLRRHTQRTWR